MELTPEERHRIEEEEKERERVRRRLESQQLAKGCLFVFGLSFVGFIVVVVVFALLLSGGGDDDAGTTSNPTYVGGLAACTHFRNVVNDASRGFLTDSEFLDKAKEVQSSAQTAEPDLQVASAAVLRAITISDVDGLVSSTEDMLTACNKYGY